MQATAAQVLEKIGAPGETRTPTPLPETDFELVAPPQKPAVIPTIRGLFASLRLNNLRAGVGMI